MIARASAVTPTGIWPKEPRNRKVHSETDQTPLHRFLNDKDVSRACSSSQQLQLAFTAELTRTQRRSDGTISLEGIRLEIPSRYGHLQKLTVRYPSWDLSSVHLSDPKTGAILCRLYMRNLACQGAQVRSVPTSKPCVSRRNEYQYDRD